MNPIGSPPSSTLADFEVTLPADDDIGVRIAGLDARTLTAGQAAEVRALVYEHKLVVFEGQDLLDAEYIDLARVLGTPQVYFQHNYHHPDHPEIFVSSNLPFRGQKIGVAGTGAYWHSDCSFFTEPLSLTMITPRVMPENPRTTLYLDLARAFEALPEHLAQRLLGLRSIHEAKWRYKVQPCDVDKSLTELLEAFDALAPAVTHPAVIDHPVNGRRCLYLSSGFTVGFEGLPAEESRTLLAEVLALMERKEFIHEHRWAAGEVTLWDNRQLNHCAGDKHENDHSTSYRIGVYDELEFYTNQPAGRLLA
ncbi:MAG: TauD/TfdA family dioxygenase [Planctomycetota bacterium]|nr:TauD/TfdA family dioxygenase [Planctomycetota bacterium]